MYKYINTILLSSIILSCIDPGDLPNNQGYYEETTAPTPPNYAIGDAYKGPLIIPDPDDINSISESDGQRDTKNSLFNKPEKLKDTKDIKEEVIQDFEIIKEIIEESTDEIIEDPDLYPPGPYSIELFGIIPDLAFYDPWDKVWMRISEYYKHPEHKALLIVSSAGWCGPCQLEASELVAHYDEYHEDGLEIAYTLLQSFELLDWIFTNPDNEEEDLYFMEQWKTIPLYNGQTKSIQYPLYADPYQVLNPYIPPNQYGLPFTILITTKDMGIRYVGKGYAPSILENKIMLVLYNELPDLPLQ